MTLLIMITYTGAILRALYSLKVKRALEATDNQFPEFLFQNFQNKIFEILEMFKSKMKFTAGA